MKKNKTLMIVLAFVLVMLLGIGLSYAYFSAIVRGTENASTLVLEAGELSINVNGGNVITATEFIPDSTTPFATKTITLTGKNTTSNLNMPYSLNLVVDENTFTAGSIKYSISGEKDENHPENGYLIPTKEMQTVDSTVTIGSGYFEPGNPITHTYTLELYFPDTNTDQSTNMNKTFKAHIEVVGVEAEEPAPSHWWKAETTTLLGLIRENSTLHTDETGMTVPGQQVNNGDEQLRMTNDDYGVSFYFRGAVTNNYVVFANKCWRIVRITGDGSIKIFYWGEITNGVCTIVDNTLESRFNNAIITNESTNNEDVNLAKRPAGIGFMYGDVMGESYDLVHANVNDSYILNQLKNWYNTSFTFTQKESLADVIWCNDKSITGGSGHGWEMNLNSLFSGRMRIYSDGYYTTNAVPTLICPAAGYDGKLSKYTANDTIGNRNLRDANNTLFKIGLLTADEAAFAGGVFNTDNNNYYLNVGESFWLMTPLYFEGNYSYVFDLASTGKVSAYNVTQVFKLHPSIALNYDVAATYNTNDTTNKPGTASNPYVIS